MFSTTCLMYLSAKTFRVELPKPAIRPLSLASALHSTEVPFCLGMSLNFVDISTLLPAPDDDATTLTLSCWFEIIFILTFKVLDITAIFTFTFACISSFPENSSCNFFVHHSFVGFIISTQNARGYLKLHYFICSLVYPCNSCIEKMLCRRGHYVISKTSKELQR